MKKSGVFPADIMWQKFSKNEKKKNPGKVVQFFSEAIFTHHFCSRNTGFVMCCANVV